MQEYPMAIIKDHYLVLGISRRENFSGILEAYRELAKQYHPDRAEPDAVDKFRDIQEAYENLSDPEKRTMYDRDVAQKKIIVQSRPEPITYPSRPRPEFRAPGPLSLLREFRSIHPSFEELYRTLRQQLHEKADFQGREDRRIECRSGSLASRIGPGWNRCGATAPVTNDSPVANCAGRGIIEPENRSLCVSLLCYPKDP
jgi:curved DNA-binding protein CbpA